MKTKTKNIILILFVAIIFSVIPAILFGKWLEALVFIVAHTLIRPQFPKQYHHIIPAMCRTISACVIFFGISFTLPMELSLLSAIPICYFISWVGFIKKNGDDFEIKCDELEVRIAEIIQELKRYKNIDLYKMNEQELRQYAQSKGLSESICDTLVLKIIHNYRWVDIQRELNFSKDGIRYHKEKIIEKLEIDL